MSPQTPRSETNSNVPNHTKKRRGTSSSTNLKHYKGEQNIGEVQTSQECGSWKPADWLVFLITAYQSNHVQDKEALHMLKLKTATPERSEWCSGFLMEKHVQCYFHETISFHKSRQKKRVARYIELPLAPLSTEAPHGSTPADRFFLVDKTNLIKFCYNQSE